MRRWIAASAVVATTTLSLAGCGLVKPSLEQLASADYGDPPAASVARQVLQSYMEPRLKDPYSAIYRCTPGRRGWVNVMGRLSYGWIVTCSVNAKNSFGGYTGDQSYNFLMRGDEIIVNSLNTLGEFTVIGG